MLVKFQRASWHSILAVFAVIPLLGLAFVPRASAQYRISVTVSPSTASVQAGGGFQQFTATVRNDRHNRGVRWTLSGVACSGSPCGTLSATTSASRTPITYTAPPNVPNPSTVTLTATSVSNTARSASATITVTGSSAARSVTISPKRGGLTITQSLPVTATVQNDAGAAGVTWSASGPACSGTTCGTFARVTSNSATYAAPNTAGIYSISAISVADVTKRASISIGVTDLTGVSYLSQQPLPRRNEHPRVCPHYLERQHDYLWQALLLPSRRCNLCPTTVGYRI